MLPPDRSRVALEAGRVVSLPSRRTEDAALRKLVNPASEPPHLRGWGVVLERIIDLKR